MLVSHPYTYPSAKTLSGKLTTSRSSSGSAEIIAVTSLESSSSVNLIFAIPSKQVFKWGYTLCGFLESDKISISSLVARKQNLGN